MCGKLWGKIMTFVLALLIIMPACAMTGCSGSKEPDNKTSVDYTVVENADLETSGYSIKVNDVYTGDNALYIDLNLIGPAAGEAVNEVETYPVIVLKMERREESVVFKM